MGWEGEGVWGVRGDRAFEKKGGEWGEKVSSGWEERGRGKMGRGGCSPLCPRQIVYGKAAE